MKPKVGQIWCFDERQYYMIVNNRGIAFTIYNIKTGYIDWSYLDYPGKWKLIQDVPQIRR